jgi:amidase
VRLTDFYLGRIDALDRSGPALNAVIELNPDAMAIARALDEERRSQGPRGLLHGIPVLIKDNIDTADQMESTAGSLALAGSRAAHDATVAERLRAAGAVLLGKTNLSEWANFRSTRSSSGWSSRGGQTRNPYLLDRNPCGSSSGSAVAVSANLCAVAVGTETDGSIICPAQTNGIVGIKPTVGLVSRAGITPIAHSQDTAGPMARCVADAAALLEALAGRDARDPATLSSPRDPARYASDLDPHALRGARLGVARNFCGHDARVDLVFEACLGLMRSLGAEIVDPASLATAVLLSEPEYEVLLYEFKSDLNAYLANRGADCPVRSLGDVIAFNNAHADRTMPYFGQEIMLLSEGKGPLTDEAYHRALETCQRLSRAEGIDAVLAQHRLDAIVAPSGGPAWLTDWVLGDRHGGNGSSSPAAVAGYPNITVPAGHVFGLPVGISFIGPAFGELGLIRLAYAFEQGSRVRRTPEFHFSLPHGQAAVEPPGRT